MEYHSSRSSYTTNNTTTKTTTETSNINLNTNFQNNVAKAAISSGAVPFIKSFMGGHNSIAKGVASAIVENAVVPQINKLIGDGKIKPIPISLGVFTGYLFSLNKSPLTQFVFMASFGFLGHKISNLNIKFNHVQNNKLANHMNLNKTNQSSNLNEAGTNVSTSSNITSNSEFIKSSEILKNTYNSYDMTGSFWAYLWGSITSNPLHVISYGLPGSGKTTLSMKFAKYFSDNFGKTAFLSSEMKNGKGLQDLIKRTNAKSILIDTEPRTSTLEQHIIRLKSQKIKLLIIDSANHLEWSSLAIETIKESIPTLSVYTILQSVKDGDFRGDNTYAHNSDIVIQVDKGKAFVKKSRFGEFSLDGVDIF